MPALDRYDALFIAWAFFLQIVLVAHFAIRKVLFESYTLKYGWIVYALGLAALAISIVLWRGGKTWPYWLGGILFAAFAAFGYWVDYVAAISFRSPFRADVGIPYVLLYLGAEMFYWWPLWNLSRPAWAAFAVLYVAAMVLNIRSH